MLTLTFLSFWDLVIKVMWRRLEMYSVSFLHLWLINLTLHPSIVAFPQLSINNCPFAQAIVNMSAKLSYFYLPDWSDSSNQSSNKGWVISPKSERTKNNSLVSMPVKWQGKHVSHVPLPHVCWHLLTHWIGYNNKLISTQLISSRI